MKTRKKIFVCSRLRGDYAQNLEIAKSLCRIVVMMGNIPIAPHVYFPQFLSDSCESERKLGIDLGISLLMDCDEVWVFGFNGISEGMQIEIEHALKAGKIVKFFNGDDLTHFAKPKSLELATFEYNEAVLEQNQRERLGD